MTSNMNAFYLPHVLLLQLLLWNRLNCQLARRLRGTFVDGNSLTVLCQFFARIDQLQWRIQIPLPSQVIFLHSEESLDSPFLALLNIRNNQSECPLIKLHLIRNESYLTNRDLKPLSVLKGSFLVLECATEPRLGFTKCVRLLERISEHISVDKLVARRLFALLLVYEPDKSAVNSMSLQLRQALLHPRFRLFSKVHAAIVTFRLESSSRNRFHFDRIIFIRPLENVCLVDESRDFLESRQLNVSLLMRRLLARDANNQVIGCDFATSKLTAVVTKSFFCEFQTEDDGKMTLLPSMELNAFRLLSEKYSFTYDAIDANGSYGRKEGNAWFGSIGYIVNQTADLALCDLIFTNDRGLVVDFSFPYDMQPVSFLTKKPGFRVRKWAFFFALPTEIWVISFITMLVCCAIINLIRRTRAIAEEDMSPNYSSFMLLLAIFWQQSFSHQEFNSLRNFEIRFIVIMWSFTSLILMRCYSGIFYSTITVPEAVPPIDTVDEVHRAAIHDTAIVFTSRYMFDMAMAAKCCDTFEYDLGQHVRRNPKLITQQNSNFETRIDNLQNYKWDQLKPFIFITSQSILKIYERYVTYAIHLSSATFLLDALGIAYQKDALYGPFFTETIVRMLETGLMDKWLRDTLLEHEHRAFLRRERKQRQKWKGQTGPSSKPQKSTAEMEAENIHNFRVDEFESVLILYLCGNALAVFAFLLQLSWRHMSESQQTVPNNIKPKHCRVIGRNS